MIRLGTRASLKLGEPAIPRLSAAGSPRPARGRAGLGVVVDEPTLGEELRRRRIAAGLSQRALGRRIERRRTVISRWESGHLEPTILDLQRLCRVLRFNVDDVVRGTRLPFPGRTWSSRSHATAARKRLAHGLERARLAAGLSIREVHRRTHIDGLRLLAIEAGRDPSLREAAALAALYGYSLAKPIPRLDTPSGLPTFRRTTPSPQEPRAIPLIATVVRTSHPRRASKAKPW